MVDRRFAQVLPSLFAPHDDDEHAAALLLRPLVGTVSTSYVIDDGDSTRPLTARELARTTTPDELHALALANFGRHVERTGIRLNGYGSIMAVIFDGDMEATLMLYLPLWARLHDEMGEHLAAAIPARDVLAVAPADSAEGLRELRAIIARVWPVDDYPLSTDLFARSDERWSVLGSVERAEDA